VVVLLIAVYSVFQADERPESLEPDCGGDLAHCSGAPLYSTGWRQLTPRRQMDVFVDGFDKTDSGWDRRLEMATSQIMKLATTAFMWISHRYFIGQILVGFRRCLAEVEPRKPPGRTTIFGLLCRYQDRLNFYMLAVSSDGYFSIRNIRRNIQPSGCRRLAVQPVYSPGKTTNVCVLTASEIR
jgi:hypothetical protein